MNNVVQIDRRRSPASSAFEAYDDLDITNQRLLRVFRDEDDMGVYVNLCEGSGEPDARMIRAGHWLNGDQCEELGLALLQSAQIIRETVSQAQAVGSG